MANANGIAVIIGDLSSNEYLFDPESIDAVALSGTWTRDSNSITWDGDNPSSTKNTSGTQDIRYLRVRTGTSFSVNLSVIANILHDPVELSEGDTIIYTSITIFFETDDLPA